ncbi:MAG TPA: SH3 domain-containing protein, partial [bacterium]|nr:SH3 domain-containing protein [bacterium]
MLTGSILLFRLTGCPAAEPLGEATVRVSAARVRAMPDLHSDILAKVNQGEKIRLLEKKKEWFRVEHAGGSGWVLGELIKIPENVFWRACLAEKTPAALRDYLKAYPAGKFAGAARSRLKKPAAPAPPAEAAVSNTEPAGEAALAGQIRSKATIENCERYLSEYPAGPAAGLARERLDPL